MKEGVTYHGILHTSKLGPRGISFILKMAKKVLISVPFHFFLFSLSPSFLGIFSHLLVMIGRGRVQKTY
jgi:hypothetical protein